MIRWVCVFLAITVASASGMQSLRPEIIGDKLTRSALRVCTIRSYIDSKDTHGDVRQLPSEPQKDTVLMPGDLDKYFHDQSNSVLPGYKNSFRGEDVRGCIYSIDHEYFSKKIFIAFPGTQSSSEWVKNFFGITNFDNNIQKSYYDDIKSVNENYGHQSFREALYKHINSRTSNYEVLDNDQEPNNFQEFEYYFTGHSRGGGLSFVSAVEFKKLYDFLQPNKIKVATFCTPRLTNAYSAQSNFINLLGYDNIVHFVRPSDVAPKFPFRFVENQGVQILLQSNPFLFFRRSHRIPSEEELERSIDQYNSAKDIGWFYPISYMTTIEAKPLIWGVGGACLSYFLLKSSIMLDLSGNLRELGFWALRKF